MKITTKPIRYLGGSLKAINKFEPDAVEEINFELHALSMGLNPNDWKPMSSIGMGVNEIRIHTKKEYRVIYVAKLKDGIYVLHAFEKKTQETPKKELNLAKKRFNDLMNAQK